MTSKIDPAKIDAYSATDYRVLAGDVGLVLRIGRSEPKLQTVLAPLARTTGAFITAYNPLGTQVDELTNKKAQDLLYTKLLTVSEAVYRGDGADPTGLWPPEPSLLALGLSRDQACSIGSEFKQDAIVWIDDQYVPELVLLR